MSIRRILKASTLVLTILLFGGITAWADPYTVEFGLDTRTITGGQFFLYFQLVDGSGAGDANNTVSLSQFNFGGGTADDASTVFTMGGATGSLQAGLTLTDSDEAFTATANQGFTAGSLLTFEATFTNHTDVGPFPDQFMMSLLNSTFDGIATTDPSINGTFLTVTLDGTTVRQPIGTVTPPTEFFAAASDSGYELPAPAAVPEASSTLLLATCCGFLGLWPKLRARMSKR